MYLSSRNYFLISLLFLLGEEGTIQVTAVANPCGVTGVTGVPGWYTHGSGLQAAPAAPPQMSPVDTWPSRSASTKAEGMALHANTHGLPGA